MNQTEKTQNFEGSLREFLSDLEDFLSANTLYQTKDIKVVFCQVPQKTLLGYIAKGLMQLDDHIFPFKVEYDMDTDTLEVTSEAFSYYLSSKDIEQFLEYERKEGEE